MVALGISLPRMSRWSVRFRRAAPLFLGLHLLQVILLAASAVCDLQAVDRDTRVGGAIATSRSAPVPSSGSSEAHAGHAHAGHTAHPAVATAAVTDVELGTNQETSPKAPHGSTHPSHHGSGGADCPMAMACTVTAVVAPVPTIATTEVQIIAQRVSHRMSTPRSMPLAPDTPPPRA